MKLDITVTATAKMYDGVTPELEAFFQDANIAEKRSVMLSGNSYDTAACEYISKQLVKCRELRGAGFSDMFTTRLKTSLP